MAAEVTDGDLLEVSFVMKIREQYCFNVQHFRVQASGVGSITDSDILTQIDVDMALLYKTYMSAGATYYGTKLQIVRPVRIDAVFTTSHAGAGTVGAEPLPSQTSLVIKKRTGFASKRRRGRMYLAGWDETQNTAAELPAAGARTLGEAVADAMLVAWAFAGTGTRVAQLYWVVWDRIENLYTDVTSYASSLAWGTQRRSSNINRPDQGPF